MNIVIVPSHNQGKNILKIISCYEKQTKRPDLLLFVFDRCSDDSRAIFLSSKTDLNIRCLIKNEGVNFSAGMTRDFGINYVVENYPDYNNIIFTDGDCLPGNKLVELHDECLYQSSIPAVSCGRRVMLTEAGEREEDERINNMWGNDYSFTDKNARLLISSRVTLESIFTYSCNLAFNKQAIELCKKINYQISGMPRVFNPEFDGSWGGEDNFISDCLYRTGNNILMAAKQCYVDHVWHKPADKKDVQTKRQICQKLSAILKTKILNGDIVGDFIIFEKNRNISFDKSFGRELNNLKKIQKDDVLISGLIEKIQFPFTMDDRDILICKYILARNVVIVNTVENNPSLSDVNDRIQKIYDYLTFAKIYLKRNTVEFERMPYYHKSINDGSIEGMLNSSKRI